MNRDLDHHDYYRMNYSEKIDNDPYLFESTNSWEELKLNFGLYQGFSWVFSILWFFVIPLIPNIAWLFVFVLPVIFVLNFLMMIYYESLGHIAFYDSITLEMLFQMIFTVFSFCFQFMFLFMIANTFNPFVLEGW